MPRKALTSLATSAAVLTAFAISGVPSGTSGATRDVESSAPSLDGDSLSPASYRRASAPRLRAVDGGRRYFGKFSGSLPTRRSYFPVAVWFEGVRSADDIRADKAVGLNTYVELTSDSSLSVVRNAGMFAIPSWGARDGRTSGYLLPDEVDMWAGPGNADWTGNYPGQGDICSPAGAECGYTVQREHTRRAPESKMLFANYGKGITFWETDEEAARFVEFPDAVSADNYWFTDPNICGRWEGGALRNVDRDLTRRECRLASNYGRTVSRVRSLVSPRGSKPVWGFVEVGHPFSEDWAPTIRPRQIRAAVWSSIIHGARGIIYFNHNFGGSCISQHVLRDDCGRAVRPVVTRVNKQIRRLAPVLNAPFVDRLVRVRGAVDVAVKLHRDRFFVLAGSRRNADQTATLKFRCGRPKHAVVLGENRRVRIKDGRLRDRFKGGNAVHLYRIRGGNTCGLG